MKILITNDDSITSAVLLPLARWAQKFGEVTVFAPKYEQSGKSHGIEIHKAFEVKKTDLLPGIEAYTVDSTPADCVRIAVLGMKRKFDLVISGINRGLNVGLDISYSGTVGAILEAACLGIPAVAISTDPAGFDHALTQLDAIADYFMENKLLDKCSLYNVNIPTGGEKICITRQGGPYYSDQFHFEADMATPHGIDVFQPDGREDLDTDCVLRCRNISISPLTLEKTDLQVFEALRK